MAPPSASSCSTNSSMPYKLPAAPLIARNLPTLLNGSSLTSSSTLPITSLRHLLAESRPPLVGDATTNQVQVQVHEAEEDSDSFPIVDPFDLLLTNNLSLQAQLNTPQARADLLDLAQGLALALAKPQDGDSVATGVAGSAASSSASASTSAVLSLVESRLLLATCYVVLALLPPAAAPTGDASNSFCNSSNPAARLAQASTQLDVARDELRDAQRRHLSSIKERRRNAANTASSSSSSSSSPTVNTGAATPPDEDDSFPTQQLLQHQARLLLAAANVAHLAGRPEHEVRRLLEWWVKARGQAGLGKGKGSGSGSGAEGAGAEGTARGG